MPETPETPAAFPEDPQAVPAVDHLALLQAATTEDDFRVQLAGAELVDVLEYIALSIFQLRGIVNQSVPMLDGLTKHPLLKGLFR